MNHHDEPPTDPEIIAQANQLRFLCSAITKVARADLETHLGAHRVGISAIEHGVLRHLTDGVTSMAEIARRMGVAPSTLVYVVDGLVERELVRREKDPKDRRREPLFVEAKGAKLFAGIPEIGAMSSLIRSLEQMKPQERRMLLRLLRELAAGLPGSDRLLRPASGATRSGATERTRRMEKPKREER